MQAGNHQEAKIFYRAMLAKDRRFDGRFFVGVHTTGIYCRSICPARKPKFENVSFYKTAAGAEESGFRPCMRCRPETAPGSPVWSGTATTVTRALRLLSAKSSELQNMEELAEKLGIGDRQLRNLFAQHLGASPRSILNVMRLDLARRLVDETSLPLSEVAFSSGFHSIRRFNDAMKGRFGSAPSLLRKKRRSSLISESNRLRLSYRPPYDWAGLLSFLKARAIPGVEFVGADTYSRTIRLSKAVGFIEVRKHASLEQLELRIELSEPSDLLQVVGRVRRIFDLDADPLAVTSHLRKDKLLSPLLKKAPGLRVPGAWDGFELAVRAIIGQQVSVSGATTVIGRLAAKFGEPLKIEHPGALQYLFPKPSDLAQADVASAGMPKKRAVTINLLAAKVANGEISFDGSLSNEELAERLLAIPGIGPWTVGYIAMRGLGDPNAFPEADLVLKRMLAQKDYRSEEWQPWRAYAAMHLWRSSCN